MEKKSFFLNNHSPFGNKKMQSSPVKTPRPTSPERTERCSKTPERMPSPPKLLPRCEGSQGRSRSPMIRSKSPTTRHMTRSRSPTTRHMSRSRSPKRYNIASFRALVEERKKNQKPEISREPSKEYSRRQDSRKEARQDSRQDLKQDSRAERKPHGKIVLIQCQDLLIEKKVFQALSSEKIPIYNADRCFLDSARSLLCYGGIRETVNPGHEMANFIRSKTLQKFPDFKIDQFNKWVKSKPVCFVFGVTDVHPFKKLGAKEVHVGYKNKSNAKYFIPFDDDCNSDMLRELLMSLL